MQVNTFACNGFTVKSHHTLAAWLGREGKGRGGEHRPSTELLCVATQVVRKQSSGFGLAKQTGLNTNTNTHTHFSKLLSLHLTLL